jgi:hypothetical protein
MRAHPGCELVMEAQLLREEALGETVPLCELLADAYGDDISGCDMTNACTLEGMVCDLHASCWHL